MARTERFCRQGIWVEAARDMNGLSYVAWKPSASRWFSERKALLKWLAWPAKTPTGDELREWLNGLESSPGGNAEPAATGPMNALDPSDPQHATRTII